jgi:hypothetical protein
VVDGSLSIFGKHGRVRSVPVPDRAKELVDAIAAELRRRRPALPIGVDARDGKLAIEFGNVQELVRWEFARCDRFGDILCGHVPKSVGKPNAVAPHIRFDERVTETGPASPGSTRAVPLPLSKSVTGSTYNIDIGLLPNLLDWPQESKRSTCGSNHQDGESLDW